MIFTMNISIPIETACAETTLSFRVEFIDLAIIGQIVLFITFKPNQLSASKHRQGNTNIQLGVSLHHAFILGSRFIPSLA